MDDEGWLGFCMDGDEGCLELRERPSAEQSSAMPHATRISIVEPPLTVLVQVKPRKTLLNSIYDTNATSVDSSQFLLPHHSDTTSDQPRQQP